MSTAIASFEASNVDAWHQWRRQGIGGSDAPIVAGRSPYRSRADLWLEKTGRVPRTESTAPYLMWGSLLEPAIAKALQRRIGCQYVGEQVCFQHDDRPWQRATLDRLTSKNEVVEFKSVNFKKAQTLGPDGDVESLPDEWILQAQHQLAVTDFALVIFGVFVGTMEDVRIYEVHRNDELIESLTDVEADFMESVRTLTPPAPFDERDAEAIVKHMGVREEHVDLGQDVLSLVDEYHFVRDQIATLDEMKESARGRIIEALGGASNGVLPDGRIVRCSVTQIAESTSTRKAHSRVNLSFKTPKGN